MSPSFQAALRSYVKDMEFNPDFTSFTIGKIEIPDVPVATKKSNSGPARPKHRPPQERPAKKWMEATSEEGQTYYWNIETKGTAGLVACARGSECSNCENNNCRIGVGGAGGRVHESGGAEEPEAAEAGRRRRRSPEIQEKVRKEGAQVGRGERQGRPVEAEGGRETDDGFLSRSAGSPVRQVGEGRGEGGKADRPAAAAAGVRQNSGPQRKGRFGEEV